MRNLARLTNAANRLQAWKDWRAIEAICERLDLSAIAEEHKPAENAGWRKIDKSISKVIQVLAEQGQDPEKIKQAIGWRS